MSDEDIEFGDTEPDDAFDADDEESNEKQSDQTLDDGGIE